MSAGGFIKRLIQIIVGTAALCMPAVMHAATAPVIGDGIAAGWHDWSWGATVDSDPTTAYNGSGALRVEALSRWDGLQLYRDSPIDATQYSYLTFAIKPDRAAHTQLRLEFAGGGSTSSYLLSDLNGKSEGEWQVYKVQLSDIGAAGKQIDGVVLQDISGTVPEPIWVDAMSFVKDEPVPAPVKAIAAVAPKPTISSSFFTLPLDVDPTSAAAQQFAALKGSGDATAAGLIGRIANQPQATWVLGDGDVTTTVRTRVQAAAGRGAMPVLVAYNIPQRDCGSYSGGGAGSAADYKAWINGFAAGIGGKPTIVIVEPDALTLSDCLSASDQQTRYGLLSYAVSTLNAAGAITYLDAGHSGWKSVGDMTSRLKAAGVSNARGFSLNVSNFNTTTSETTYGQAISKSLGGAHFVVDTSRNGNGADGANWCNPAGRALGSVPRLSPGVPNTDAYLWIKRPGESDGACNGGPNAGAWWLDYALGLARAAK